MGKEYMYKGKGYQLDALSKLCAEGVTKSSLSQRICTGNMTIEEAVDTPRVAYGTRTSKRSPRRKRLCEHKNSIKPKIQCLFWAKTSVSNQRVREC